MPFITIEHLLDDHLQAACPGANSKTAGPDPKKANLYAAGFLCGALSVFRILHSFQNAGTDEECEAHLEKTFNTITQFIEKGIQSYGKH